MDSDKVISVIIPVYKTEKYIKRCIESIIEQTYKRLQIIIIEDGSPDSCADICDYYAEIDSRIIVIHQLNAGVSAARNAGLRIAKGHFISFVDSDDYLMPDTYDTLIKALKGSDADMAVMESKFVDDNNQTIVQEKKSKEPLVMTSKEALKIYFDVPTPIRRGVTTKIYSIKLFNDGDKCIRFDEQVHASEDCTVFVDCIFKCNKIVFVRKELYVSCIHNGSAMNGGLNVWEILKSFSVQKEILDKVINVHSDLRDHAYVCYIDYCAFMIIKYSYSHDSDIMRAVYKMKKVLRKEMLNIIVNRELNIKQKLGYIRTAI